jgi:HKD family nuclease
MAENTTHIDHSDLTFFTNEEGQSLLSRFKATLKDTQLFDVLVGYFRTSGFYQLYESL